MFIKKYLLVILCFSAAVVNAQTLPESNPLEPGQPIERSITGGQDQTYKISMTANQFVRLRLDQTTLDSALILVAPDGKPLAEMNLTSPGEQETLALETVTGTYNLTVRGIGNPKMSGSYRLEMTIQPAASETDRKYLTAQNLLLDSQLLAKQAPQPPQVIEKLEQSLAIWRSLDQPFWESLTLKEIGKTYMGLNRYDKAIESQQQAIAICQQLKNRIREGVVLNDLANSYYNQQQFDKAAEIFQRCIAIFRELKDRRREGLMIYALGNAQRNMNQPEKAIASFEQARPILREVNDRNFEGQLLLSLGNVYLNTGQPDKAIDATDSAVTIFHEVKNYASEGQARINLGVVYSRLSQSEKAIATLEPAITIFRDTKNRQMEGVAITTLGLIHGERGDAEKAAEYFEKGLAIARDLKDRKGEANALNNLGLAYSFLSKYEKAIEYLEQALPIVRANKNLKGEASTFSYLGINYVKLSQFEKAIECHERGLAIFRELKDRVFEGNQLENIGNVYKLLGRDDKAVDHFNQALVVFREVKYRIGEADILSGLSDSYIRLNRDEEAIRTQEQALAIYREVKYRLGEATSLLTMGTAYSKLGKYEKAIGIFEEALPILREVKNRENEGLALFKMGEAMQQIGRSDEAADLLNRSVVILRDIGSKNFEFGALTSLARVQRSRGELAAAQATVEQSLQISETLRSEIISPESRAAFLSGVQDSYKLYTDLLMRRHLAEPQNGFDQMALETAERQRARSLLDLLAESKTDVRQGVDPILLDAERSVAKTLSEKAQTLERTDKPDRAAVLKTEISRLETDLERAQTAIRKANPGYSALVKPQPLKFKEIQAQLDPDTLLLEYSLGEDRSYLWALSKDSVTSYELPKEAAIQRNALQVYEMLTARNTVKSGETEPQRRSRMADGETKLPGATQALSQVLLGPVAARFGNKRLVIVADGALQYIPFAMLPDPAAGYKQPLVVRHEIVSLPSASALAVQRAELDGRQPAPKMLAVIADPVFDRTDDRFKSIGTQPRDNAAVTTPVATSSAADARSLEHIAEASDGASGSLVIRRLQFTRQEADSLLALVPKAAEMSLVDFDANRITVLGGGLSQYRYVHFATHGFLDTERPGLSALVLSTIGADGKPRDGFLRANDIYNLKLPAELVVLSACQTGLGKEVK